MHTFHPLTSEHPLVRGEYCCEIPGCGNVFEVGDVTCLMPIERGTGDTVMCIPVHAECYVESGLYEADMQDEAYADRQARLDARAMERRVLEGRLF